MTQEIVLRPVGFFADLPFGASWSTATLREAVGLCSLGAPEKDRMLEYLRAGHQFMQIMTHVIDPLDPTQPAVSAGLLMTDGIWAWPESYAYFLARYDVEVPEDFVAYARRSGFRIKPVNQGARFTLPGVVYEDDLPDSPSAG